MTKTRQMVTAAAALLFGLAAAAAAATATLGAGSRIRLEGDSTMHKFHSESTELKVDFEVAPGLAAGIQANAPVKMKVTVPVATLKSDKSGLDKNLRKALMADKHPDIVFALKSYTVERDTVTTVGDLTIAGKTQTRTVAGTLKWKDGRALVDGEHALLMTDFGIKPPTMMLGAVKTDDRILVKFHLELSQAADELKGEAK